MKYLKIAVLGFIIGSLPHCETLKKTRGSTLANNSIYPEIYNLPQGEKNFFDDSKYRTFTLGNKQFF